MAVPKVLYPTLTLFSSPIHGQHIPAASMLPDVHSSLQIKLGPWGDNITSPTRKAKAA